MKAVNLLATFPKYRIAIARYEESKLRQSTMKTFFKEYVCPAALYDPAHGGNRADSMNICRFINGSEVLWMNLKDTDEGFVRGLEVNSVLVDQAEEISENMYLMLSARVNRWDLAEVPNFLLKKYPDWKISPKTGRPAIPSYMMILCNPDSELHWIYKRYHPDSEDWQKKYRKNHVMVQGASTIATLDEESLAEMESNDPAWVERFVRGKWGIPGGQIHTLLDESVIRPTKEFVDNLIARGNLYRVLDHGDSAPTCCLWFAAYKDWYFCYREYYKPGALISEHRQAIADLSGNERYNKNIADPAIFKKMSQKYGGRWSVADEYSDKSISDKEGAAFLCPPLYWQEGDNNEFATRNRISELLRFQRHVSHPLLGHKPAPRLYFLERTEEYPNGAYFAIQQLKAQKREKVGTIDGKDIFSDDRNPHVADHAYDCIRYYCADHLRSPAPQKPKAPAGSFFNVRKQMIAQRKFAEQIQ